MPHPVVLALAAFCTLALALHLASAGLTLWRLRRPARGRGRATLAATPATTLAQTPAVTLVRPVCGLEHRIEDTLRSSFALSYPDYEVIFCAATPRDPVVPLVERLIAEHPHVPARLLTGDDPISGNPKLNNVVKGWRAARADWIVMSDSNVLLPPDYIERLLERWTPGTGLVSCPPVGLGGEGLWGALECAFLNTYQARWQLSADCLGMGYAQGKTLFWRREVLEQGGGLARLGTEMAEDVASTKLVRRAGLKVRLARVPFPQPVGPRRPGAVWGRQLRWAKVRRLGFPLLFAQEIFSGSVLPFAAVAGLAAAGGLPWGALPGYVALWYAAEWGLARAAGWPAGPRDVLAFVLRDLMLPALWLGAWFGRGFTWRGNQMEAAGAAGLRPLPEPVAD